MRSLAALSGFMECAFIVSRIRWFCVLFFILFTLTTVGNIKVFMSIDQSLHPWQLFSEELNLLETIRFYMMFIIGPSALYLGYRCIANELDEAIVELNKDLNRIFLAALLKRYDV